MHHPGRPPGIPCVPATHAVERLTSRLPCEAAPICSEQSCEHNEDNMRIYKYKRKWNWLPLWKKQKNLNKFLHRARQGRGALRSYETQWRFNRYKDIRNHAYKVIRWCLRFSSPPYEQSAINNRTQEPLLLFPDRLKPSFLYTAANDLTDIIATFSSSCCSVAVVAVSLGCYLSIPTLP